jgi:hypothetical protein
MTPTQGQNTQGSDKFLTITTLINLKGYVFRPNQQYCYEDKIILQVGCGCGNTVRKDVLHYRVRINNVVYDIPENYVTETIVPIACEDQDFELRREGIGNRTIDGVYITDYNPYRNNPDPFAIAKDANNIPM